jgi:hypothetical protein
LSGSGEHVRIPNPAFVPAMSELTAFVEGTFF